MSKIKSEYTFAGERRSGLFRRIQFFYCPLHSLSWAIRVNGEARYFRSIKECLDCAKKNNWIKEREIPSIIAELAEMERALDGRLFSKSKLETPESGDFSFHRR